LRFSNKNSDNFFQGQTNLILGQTNFTMTLEWNQINSDEITIRATYKGSKSDCTLCDTEEEQNFTSFIEILQ